MTSTPLAEWFATDIDLRHNQIFNAAVHRDVTAPPNPVKGQLWYDDSTVPGTLKYYDGTMWTGGRTFYNTLLDDSSVRPQRGKLNFRSSTSIAAAVLDESAQDQSSVQLTAMYGPVVPVRGPGETAYDGVAQTLARSDHTHGSAAASGADSVLISWWQHNQELWAQLVAAANFVYQLPGQVVGGGWMLTAPGSIYWTGEPIPVSPQGVYRNSIRVSAVNGTCQATAGWLCYDANKNLLGKVKCINSVPVETGTESGSLVARNYATEPGAEKPFTDPDSTSDYPGTWHSNSIFGSGAIGTVTRSAEQHHSGSYSVKVVWPNFGTGNTQSNVLLACAPVPPNTKLTLSGWVYVPTGSPDVRLDAIFYATSPPITLRDQWVYVELPFTSADDGAMHTYFVGLSMVTNGQTGKVAYLDDVMLRIGWDPLPNGMRSFDGDTPDTSSAIYAWDGTFQDSTSSWYVIEPSWEIINGYIAFGDGTEPPAGQYADVENAVTPLAGTVFFRPYVECPAGTMLVDTHEVARGTRDMTVADGMHVGWATVDGTMQATEVTTTDVAPPETSPPSFLRIGPVNDPPQADTDVVAKAYVDRVTGQPGVDTDTGLTRSLPPQFQWSGEPGVTPTPADLGFLFDTWPLFSMWLDASVAQVKPMVIAGTWMGTAGYTAPAVGTTWTQVPNSYGVVFTPPADGVVLGISSGSVYALYNEYMEMQCRAFEGVDVDGNGGTSVGNAGQQIFSGASGVAAAGRQGYVLPTFIKVTGGLRYKMATFYQNGGPGVTITRDRTFVIYLPGWGYRP